MSVTKPAFSLPVADLSAKLDTVQSVVDKVKAADGSVSIKALYDAAEQSGDPALAQAVDAIFYNDAFVIHRTTPSVGGCGGSGTTTSRPSTLDAAQVQTVRQALLDAKTALARADAVVHKDGKLSYAEARAVIRTGGLPAKLAASTIAAPAGYLVEYNAWADAVAQLYTTHEARVAFDAALVRAAEKHAATTPGAQAILWSYRQIASLGKAASMDEVEQTLQGAETSWLAKVPVFGRLERTRKGHLSDREISQLLGAKDLLAYVDEQKVKIKQNLGGGDYLEDFLAGKDLVGLEQVQDPDYQAGGSAVGMTPASPHPAPVGGSVIATGGC